MCFLMYPWLRCPLQCLKAALTHLIFPLLSVEQLMLPLQLLLEVIRLVTLIEQLFELLAQLLTAAFAAIGLMTCQTFYREELWLLAF